MSRSLDLPVAAKLWNTCTAPTLVVHGPEAPMKARTRWDDQGIERIELSACEPKALLKALAHKGCNQVLWECGPQLAAAALKQAAVQEIFAVIAPKLLGGVLARTPLGDLGLDSVEQAIPCRFRERFVVQGDWIVRTERIEQGNGPHP